MPLIRMSYGQDSHTLADPGPKHCNHALEYRLYDMHVVNTIPFKWNVNIFFAGFYEFQALFIVGRCLQTPHALIRLAGPGDLIVDGLSRTRVFTTSSMGPDPGRDGRRFGRHH